MNTIKANLKIALILSETDGEACGQASPVQEIPKRKLLKAIRFDLDSPLLSSVKVTGGKIREVMDHMIHADACVRLKCEDHPDQLSETQRQELETDLITGMLTETNVKGLSLTYVGYSGEVELVY